MKYRIGIDAGSKTIKVVTLDGAGKPVHAVYRRHRSNIKETAEEILHDLVWRYGDLEGSVAITGSAGIELAKTCGLPFVQEVIATTKAVQSYLPEADAIIELGGEDAKVVYLSGGMEQRMNATCAGGTGGFIDTIAFMLGVRTKEMNGLAMGASRIYPIASRCAVFAQTDVRPLLNSGAKKSDIAASALEAVVKQTIGGLACGRPITGNVVFLGGPLEHLPDLVYRFRRALGLTHRSGIKPTDAHLFTAMGAALLGPELSHQIGCPATVSLTGLEQAIRKAPEVERDIPSLAPLFTSEREREEFKARHASAQVPRKRLSDCIGPLYLGIDAGSTTVKMALIDTEKNLVYSDYRPTKGDTLQTATLMLEELYRFIPHEYDGRPLAFIAHATVTGYGEDLLKAAFNADSGTVETIAHVRAAQSLHHETDFILDIGGQDMKALWIKGGMVVNAVLNEACSSGCGSFIEGTAYSLKLSPYTFADLALQATAPVDLGMKCTVFMTSRVRHAQKIGVSYADIAAGLAYSVVKNALFKIIGMHNLDELGDTVVVQGGAFMSDAVLRAFELVSGKRVIRPDIAHLMGAFGAALIALQRGDARPSRLISKDDLGSLNPKKQMHRCIGCPNACLLTIMEFDTTRNLISGNRCSRAIGIYGRNEEGPSAKGSTSTSSTSKATGAARPPDLYALEQKLLERYRIHRCIDETGNPRSRVHIGIPHVLHLYESLPFWHTLFTELGFSVIVAPDGGRNASSRQAFSTSGPSSDQAPLTMGAVHVEGLETVPSESVCYPAKISHIRLAELLDADADAVFMPHYVRGSRCPVSSMYAQALESNAPAFGQGDVEFISPVLQSIDPEKLMANEADRERVFDSLASYAAASKPLDHPEFDAALQKAFDEQTGFRQTLDLATEKALAWLESPGKRGVILAGRPYHADPDVSHAINRILADFGFAVLSPAGLRILLRKEAGQKHSDDNRSEDPSTVPKQGIWKPAKTLDRLARFTMGRPNLDLICMNSFGCGFDALSTAAVKEALEGEGRICTSLKIDDIIDLAHIRIRLRTLAETLEGQQDMCQATERAGHGKSFLDDRSAQKPLRNDAGSRIERTAPMEGIASYGPEIHRHPLVGIDATGTTGFPADKDRCIGAVGKTAFLGALTQDDIEAARAYVSHDVCFVVSAITGRAINVLRNDPEITRLVISEVCIECLLSAIPDLIERTLGWKPEIIWQDRWDKAPSGTCDQTLGNGSKPCIGILGNAFLCFDTYANRHVVDLLEGLGCIPVMPNPEALFVDDVRYLDIIEGYLSDGVEDIIYIQAFGCLKGHVESRGSLRDIQKRFPGIRLTIIDCDNDTSILNQENRIRLAVSAAFEHEKKTRHASR